MGRNYLKRARRRLPAGIKTRIGNHTFRATGITAYLKNGGMLETAQQMAAHESPRTTGLYDRRSDDLSLDRTRSPWRCATSARLGATIATQPTGRATRLPCASHCIGC
jgi:integrase